MTQEHFDVIGQLMQEIFQDRDGLKRLLEALLESAMCEEVQQHLGAGPYERTEERKGHRNGAKSRKLKTRVGELELDVPQVRGCEPYHPSMFARWQRSERALLTACAEMYFQGVSTRNVRKVLERMCGGDISSATVSRVALELDEKLELFRDRRLGHTNWPYMLIDARYEKVRVNGAVVSQAVLVAVGINGQGGREILDWRVDDSESESTWSDLFRSLKDRGLNGLRMVTSDAHKGIRAAIDRHFQGVLWQRCRVHFKRELGRKVSYKRRKELYHDLVAVFAPEDRSECLQRAEEMAACWEVHSPKVARMLREGTGECLTVLELPATHRLRLKSTNMLENLMKRLRKRTKVVGVMPSRDSCDRLIGAQLVEVHEAWAVDGKAYISMECDQHQRPAPVGRAAA